MSSGFTVNANHFLRNMYSGTDRTLSTSAGRESASKSKLTFADSQALKKAISELGSFDYSLPESEVNESMKTKFSKDVRAFVDAYNYTMESAKGNDDEEIRKAGKKMKAFSEKNKDLLNSVGIEVKGSGYLSYDNSRASSLYLHSFGKAFASDAEYMQGVSKYASKINNHVDYYA